MSIYITHFIQSYCICQESVLWCRTRVSQVDQSGIWEWGDGGKMPLNNNSVSIREADHTFPHSRNPLTSSIEKSPRIEIDNKLRLNAKFCSKCHGEEGPR